MIRNASIRGELEAQAWGPQGPTGDTLSIESLTVIEWAGTVEGQDIDWVKVRMTLQGGSSEEGYMALFVLVVADAASCYPRLPGYPVGPEPDPEYRFVSCYLYGDENLGIDCGNMNIRDITDTTSIRSIEVGQRVELIGHQDDPTVLARIGTGLSHGVIQDAPLPNSNLPDSVINQGYSMIGWEDSDPSTSDYWWILTSVLKVESDCETHCPIPTLTTPNSPVPTITPTSVFESLYQDMQPIYATPAPYGINPPALIGNYGIHHPIAGSNSWTIDTVPLSVESCVDAGICGQTYSSSDSIPVYAPVSGSLISGYGMPDYTVVIKVPVDEQTSISISLTHLDPASLRPDSAIHQGDRIGYLCPQNARTACMEPNDTTATHLAIGLSVIRGHETVVANPQELLWFLENLQDCYPAPGGWDFTRTNETLVGLLNSYLGQQPNFCPNSQ